MQLTRSIIDAYIWYFLSLLILIAKATACGFSDIGWEQIENFYVYINYQEFSGLNNLRRKQHESFALKGTLRRRLSHGYFSFIAKYTSNWLMSHRSHPQIFTFKGAGPNFFSMTQGNLIHALVESWKFDPVINSHASRLWITFLHSL